MSDIPTLEIEDEQTLRYHSRQNLYRDEKYMVNIRCKERDSHYYYHSYGARTRKEALKLIRRHTLHLLRDLKSRGIKDCFVEAVTTYIKSYRQYSHNNFYNLEDK